MQAHCPEGVEGVGALLLVVHQHALGELETEMPRVESSRFERAAHRIGERPPELTAREVGRDPDGAETGSLPLAVLGARGLHDPFTERNDEAVLLGKRDEL